LLSFFYYFGEKITAGSCIPDYIKCKKIIPEQKKAMIAEKFAGKCN